MPWQLPSRLRSEDRTEGWGGADTLYPARSPRRHLERASSRPSECMQTSTPAGVPLTLSYAGRRSTGEQLGQDVNYPFMMCDSFVFRTPQGALSDHDIRRTRRGPGRRNVWIVRSGHGVAAQWRWSRSNTDAADRADARLGWDRTRLSRPRRGRRYRGADARGGTARRTDWRGLGH
jgi:hypothetical protein